MWVTWKHEDRDFASPLTYAQKVEIFGDQTLGWQLHIAELVANGGTTFGEFKKGLPGYEVRAIRHSGFAVLHMCLSYIELVGSLVHSAPQSSIKTFESGLRAIPGLIDSTALTGPVVKRLYVAVRCGLYHEGRTRPGVGLGFPPDGNAIGVDAATGTIGLSPERLPRVLKEHLEQLRADLMNPVNLALSTRFEQRFDSGFQ